MSKVTTISEAGNLVREMIQNDLSTQYFVLSLDSKEYKIRVSDHSARSANNRSHGEYNGYFSFITGWNKQDSNMKNEWVLDADGDFIEEFINIEECLDWNIN